MPTENRSLNPAMVSVPRHLVLDAITFAWDHDANGNVAALQNWLDQPAPQPHPDPIAWMVRTAFWWTKEEAERDAAAMGLPVVPLGPMGGSGNPSAWLNTATGAVTTSAVQVMDWDDDGEPVQSLYTHADPGEVERLRAVIDQQKSLIASLRAELVESYSIDASAEPSAPVPFQARVQPWLMQCFGEMIAGDREERNHRFLEEALELVQALGATAAEAHQLVDYVFGRAVGEPAQEVGGVMVTLAALCLANGLDMHRLAETELARIWTKVDAIRAKQASKPQFGPLPGVYPDRKQ